MKKRTSVLGGIAVLGALQLFGCAKSEELYSADNPVSISIWTYYNGKQLESFQYLVDEFNRTKGAAHGIFVEASSQGHIEDLEQKILRGVDDSVASSDLPNIFMAYADTSYEVYKQGKAVDLTKYLTPEECSEYVDAYLEEGDLSGDGSYYIFPVAKSTEVLVLNQTDWDKFAGETGASLDQLKTMEGITETARQYYEWTDAMTPDVPNDGKAFWGRDSLANYMLIGAMQMGNEIFAAKDGTLDLQYDPEVIRRLWDCYYVPMVKGYFASAGKFRSDDMKIGNIIAYVGATSGLPFVSREVNTEDGQKYPIELQILPCPVFEGGEPVVVQQGAGMVVTTGSEAKEKASVEFLKWFTDTENNMRFSIESGYLPVKKEANDPALIGKYKSDAVQARLLEVAFHEVNQRILYTPPIFEQETSARDYLQSAITSKVTEDRQIVVDRMAEGMTPEEAWEEFMDDENFESWYRETYEELMSYQAQ